MKNFSNIFLLMLFFNFMSFSSIALPINSLLSSKNLDYGTYVFSNGDKYVGFFKDNKFHGQGTFTWIEGETFSGKWKNGYMTEKGTYTYSDGTIENFSETIKKWKKIKNKDK